jgi:hypothetical protein
MARSDHLRRIAVMYRAGRTFLLSSKTHSRGNSTSDGDVMTTEAALAPDTGIAGGSRPDVCGCGQDLDGCWREHCPRCGCHVTHAA